MNRPLRYALIGAATGLIILGGGSRALMRGVTLITGSTPIYTLGGTVEVIASGALYGTLGGVLMGLFPNRWGGWRGWIHWPLFLSGIILLSGTARAEFGAVVQQAKIPVLVAFALLVLIDSLILSAITRRTGRFR